jgi:hypothetical protein
MAEKELPHKAAWLNFNIGHKFAELSTSINYPIFEKIKRKKYSSK